MFISFQMIDAIVFWPDGIGVQAGVQVVETLHLLLCFQTVRDHVLSKDLLH